MIEAINLDTLKILNPIANEIVENLHFYNGLQFSLSQLVPFATVFTEVDNIHQHITIPVSRRLLNQDMIDKTELLEYLKMNDYQLGFSLRTTPLMSFEKYDCTEIYILRHKKINDTFIIIYNNHQLVFKDATIARKVSILLYTLIIDIILYDENG